MVTTAPDIAQRYQQPLWGQMDRVLRNCFRASAALGAAVLIVIFVAPALPPETTTVNDIPERIARLILEKPKPSAPPATLRKQISRAEVQPVAKPKPPPTRRRTSKPRPTPSRGTQGRQKAQQEVTQHLAQVTGSLDKVVENLSKSLPASENSNGDKPRSRRRRGVRSGRTTQQLSSVQDLPDVSSADMSASAIESEGISISAITDLTVNDAAGGEPGGSGSTTGAGPAGRNEFRSNESLLNVVRRYAPGIQFCYDNELKKNPGLRGKLVVSLTVLANGRVSEAFIVEDTLDSSAVTQCVLSQIRGWQFPEIPHGSTSFRTPFVFTPPQ